ncbi:MAG TPA: hypothetical protein VJ508_03180 [Saprospiraceae bacterium]|nr:hypothetical protein [Saprospiraceae bacterium]
MNIHSLFTSLLLLGLVSCSPQYSYFTQNLYENQKWTQEDIRRIQFYVSRDIVLTRSLTDGDSKIAEGKIRIRNGRKVEQVVIKTGTPGVLVLMPKEDRFAISFEPDDNDAYLMFGPNPKLDNRYALLAQTWEQQNGKVHYKGNVYDVDSSSAYASLMVDLQRIGSNEYQTHRAQGRTIKN